MHYCIDKEYDSLLILCEVVVGTFHSKFHHLFYGRSAAAPFISGKSLAADFSVGIQLEHDSVE